MEVYNHIGPEEPTPKWFWPFMICLVILCAWVFYTVLEGFPV